MVLFASLECWYSISTKTGTWLKTNSEVIMVNYTSSLISNCCQCCCCSPCCCQHICPTCNGSGQASKYCHCCGSYTYRTCTHCNGTGRIHNWHPNITPWNPWNPWCPDYPSYPTVTWETKITYGDNTAKTFSSGVGLIKKRVAV